MAVDPVPAYSTGPCTGSDISTDFYSISFHQTPAFTPKDIPVGIEK